MGKMTFSLLWSQEDSRSAQHCHRPREGSFLPKELSLENMVKGKYRTEDPETHVLRKYLQSSGLGHWQFPQWRASVYWGGGVG
jgi:hypothetical protein